LKKTMYWGVVVLVLSVIAVMTVPALSISTIYKAPAIVDPVSIAINPADPKEMFAAYAYRGAEDDNVSYVIVSFSKDGGETWSNPVVAFKYIRGDSENIQYNIYNIRAMYLSGKPAIIFTHRDRSEIVSSSEKYPPSHIGLAIYEDGSWKVVRDLFDPGTIFASEGLRSTTSYVIGIDAAPMSSGGLLIVYSDYAWYTEKYHLVALTYNPWDKTVHYTVLYTVNPGEIDLYSVQAPVVYSIGDNKYLILWYNLYNATVMATLYSPSQNKAWTAAILPTNLINKTHREQVIGCRALGMKSDGKLYYLLSIFNYKSHPITQALLLEISGSSMKKYIYSIDDDLAVVEGLGQINGEPYIAMYGLNYGSYVIFKADNPEKQIFGVRGVVRGNTAINNNKPITLIEIDDIDKGYIVTLPYKPNTTAEYKELSLKSSSTEKIQGTTTGIIQGTPTTPGTNLNTSTTSISAPKNYKPEPVPETMILKETTTTAQTRQSTTTSQQTTTTTQEQTSSTPTQENTSTQSTTNTAQNNILADKTIIIGAAIAIIFLALIIALAKRKR